MGSGHDHAAGTKNEGRVIAALSLTTFFLIAEVVAGLLTFRREVEALLHESFGFHGAVGRLVWTWIMTTTCRFTDLASAVTAYVRLDR